MSELDLGLKVGVRSLLWSMGYSTRLDVELRGDGARPGKGQAAQTFTDLDVLGVLVRADNRLSTAIADCKSGTRDKPTARMFWARGVADLFGAETVMLVREHEVADATRQLSSRLGIQVLPSTDLAKMQQLHGPPLSDMTSPLALMFDRTAVATQLAAFRGLDKRLKALNEYREFDYWVYDAHRNPFQLVAHLQQAHAHLDPKNPIHLALFLDLAWLYLVSLVPVLDHIRGAFLSDPDRGLQEYLFGGALGLREKQDTAALLNQIRPEGAPTRSYLPPYYRDLRELVTRLLRRPEHLQPALRCAESASALMAARVRVTLPAAFGDDTYDLVAAKLVADVCGFLVEAGQVNPEFKTQARAYLLSEPVHRPSPTAVAPEAMEAARAADPTDFSDSEDSRDTEKPENPGDPRPVTQIDHQDDDQASGAPANAD